MALRASYWTEASKAHTLEWEKWIDLFEKSFQPNFRIILEISNSSAEAGADQEEYFDISADSLEMNCKRMRLNSTFESLESGELPNTSAKSAYSEMREALRAPMSKRKTKKKDSLTKATKYQAPSQ